MQQFGLANRRLMTKCALLAVATCAMACGGEAQRPHGRTLVVGIDGMSPVLVERMLAEGELPHLAALAQRGSWGRLRSLEPILSPRIWTSMATGKLPEAHGIEHFARTDANGEPRLFSSLDRRVPAVWSIASDAGFTVGVVNWLMTHPPERVRGVMISDHAAPGALAGRLGLAAGVLNAQRGEIAGASREAAVAHPAAWVERFEALGTASGPLTEIPNPFAKPLPGKGQRLWNRLADILARDEHVVRAALEVDTELRPDLLLVYVNGLDAVSHFFWPSVAPDDPVPPAYQLPPEVSARQRAALRATYRFADALVGALARGFGAEDLVLVVSDHGFETARPGDRSAGVHFTERAIDGIVFAAAPGVRAGGEIRGMSVTDVAPTLLAWLGLAIGSDMSGRVADFLPIEARRIDSWDELPVEHVGGTESGAEDAIVEQLRALGYLE